MYNTTSSILNTLKNITLSCTSILTTSRIRSKLIERRWALTVTKIISIFHPRSDTCWLHYIFFSWLQVLLLFLAPGKTHCTVRISKPSTQIVWGLLKRLRPPPCRLQFFVSTVVVRPMYGGPGCSFVVPVDDVVIFEDRRLLMLVANGVYCTFSVLGGCTGLLCLFSFFVNRD